MRPPALRLRAPLTAPLTLISLALLSPLAHAGGGSPADDFPPNEEVELFWDWHNPTASTWFNPLSWLPFSGTVPNEDNIAALTGGHPVLDQDVTLLGYYQWNGDGATTLSGTGVLHVGTLYWGSGVQSGTGGATVSGSAVLGTGTGYASLSLEDGRSLALSGSSTFQATALSLRNGSAIYNNGSFTSVGERRNLAVYDNQILAEGSGNAFHNNGSFVQDADGHATVIRSTFHNRGTVSVVSGSLSLSGGGQHSGSFAVQAGQQLSFAGDHVFAGGLLHNDGQVSFGTGNVNVAATTGYSGAGRLKVDGAQLVLGVSAGMHVAELEVHNGLLDARAGLDNTLRTDLLMLHDAGRLSGEATLDAQALSWTGGRMSGPATTRVHGEAELGDGLAYRTLFLDNGRTLELRGDSVFQAGFIGLSQASRIVNQGDFLSRGDRRGAATYDSAIVDYNSNGRFHNLGRFTQDADGHTTTIHSGFDNSGVLRVASGTLKLLGGGGHTGQTEVLAGQTLALNGTHAFAGGSMANDGTLQVLGGTTTLSPATTYSGQGDWRVSGGTLHVQQAQVVQPGQVQLDSGTLRADSAVQAGHWVQHNGILSGTGDVQTGTLQWQNGSMNGSGLTRVTGSATLGDGSSYASVNLNGRHLVLAGDTTLQALQLGMSDGAVLDNLGVLRNLGDVRGGTVGDNALVQYRIGADSLLRNAGRFIQDTAGHQTRVDMRFDNTGELRVDSGRMLFGSGLNLLGDDSVLNLAVHGLTQDLLDVNAQALLDGTLTLRFEGFQAQAGDVIRLFSYDSFLGGFDHLRALNLGEGLHLSAIYGSDGFSVRVSAVPEPQSWALLLAGLGIVLTVSRRTRMR